MPAPSDRSLDPTDWAAFALVAHRVLDRALEHLGTVRERPLCQPVPEPVRQALSAPLPLEGRGAEATAAVALRSILPYATGNVHPRFFGWVHGAGTAGNLLAEILAATMNANLGGRDHGAIYVERQVIEWCRQLFGFPIGTSGLLVSGTSMATLIGLAVARHHQAGCEIRIEASARSRRAWSATPRARPTAAWCARSRSWGWAAARCARSRSAPTTAWTSRSCDAPSPPTGVSAASRSASSAPPARSTPARSTI